MSPTIEHLARVRAPATAVPLQRPLRRRLGVGNSTGLGMAPFLVSHPALLHAWVSARESALARVRSLPRSLPGSVARFADTLARARSQVAGWTTGDARQQARIVALGDDLERLAAHLRSGHADGHGPWDALYRWGEGSLTLEGQEMLVSLLIEPHGELVDDLAGQMAADEAACFRIDGARAVGEMADLIERDYDWALAVDYDDPQAQARFWYVSEEKLEPRLGERRVEPGAELEQPYAAGRDVAALHRALRELPRATPLADLLLACPEHRHAARRVQIAGTHPYAEIRDNLVDSELVPVDMLRCKLSFFGATRFDPRSDRWVRITMYKDAPFPDEFAEVDVDDSAFPPALPAA